MDKTIDIITIGESLIEFSTNQKVENAECLHKYYGGDSLVVAVAAKRLLSNVGFITCFGEDPFKDYLIHACENEGLDISSSSVVDEKNGMYIISRPQGEKKEFVYYRKKIAPAKLSIDNVSVDYLTKSKIVYASGVTQSLSIQSREAVKKAFSIAKENGIITAYDPNFSKLISSRDAAKEYFEEVAPLIDIFFISQKNDFDVLFELDSVEKVINTLHDLGISTIVVKSSKDKGYYLSYQQNTTFIPFYTENVVDTTSTGDAFNGAFLHSISHSYSYIEAAKIASIAAGLQTQGIGAIKSVPYYDEVFKIYASEV